MIETVYTLTKEEFIEGQRLWCPGAVRKLPGHWPIQGVYIAFGVLFGLAIPNIPIPLGIAFALWLAAFIALAKWRKTRLQSTQFQQLEDSLTDISLKADAFGYHEYKEGSGSCSIAWRRFSGWLESSNVFVLGMNRGLITIPKSALSQDQQNELHDLLRTAIKPSSPPAQMF